MQDKSHQLLWYIDVILDTGNVKTVAVKAASREVAEHRALKRTTNGVSIKRND